MKLHLPKMLLAAVMGVMSMSSLRAETVTITNDTGTALNAGDYTRLTSDDTLVFALTDTNSNRYWSGGGTIKANIVIGSDTVGNSGMYIYNGNQNISVTYTGTVTGSGTMSKKNSGTNNHWIFRGNVSGFTGGIWLETTVDDSRKFYLDFENAENSEPGTAENVSGTGTITFASGTGNADDSGGNWLTYNYTTSVYTTADNALTVGNVITRSADNIQSRVEIKGTAAMKFTNTVTLAKLKLSTHTQDVTLTSGLVENITGTTGNTIRKAGVGELTIGNTSDNNLVVSEGKLKIRQGATASFASLSVTGGEMDIYGTFHMTEAVNVGEGGSLNVMSGARIDTSALSGDYKWSDETSTLTYTTTIGTGWTIDSGATVGVWSEYDYNSATGEVKANVEMQVVSTETFTWGGATPGEDDAGAALGSSGAYVRFAGGSTQSVTLAENTSTPFLLIEEGTTVTMTRGAVTFQADRVLLGGGLRIKDNTGYSVSMWDGDGELILDWGDYRTDASSIAGFSGNLRIAAGTGLRISDGNRTFSKVTVENGASFCINNSDMADGQHHHVGDIYISGDGGLTGSDGTVVDDTIGALKLGGDRHMKGNVHIVGGSAAISGWNSEHGYINGDIIGDGGNAILKTLNANKNGSGQLLDVVNIRSVSEVDLSSGTLKVTGDVTNDGGGFTKKGAGTLTVEGTLTVKSDGTVTMKNGTMTVGSLSNVANVSVDTGKTMTVTGGVTVTDRIDTPSFSKKGDGTLVIGGNVSLSSSLAVESGTLVIEGSGTVNVTQPVGNQKGQLNLWNAGTLKIDGGREIGVLTIGGDGTLNGGTLNIANGSIGLQQNLVFNKRNGAETIVLGNGTNAGTLKITNGQKITYASSLSVIATSDDSSVSGTGGNGLSVAATDQTFTNLTVGTSADTDVAARLNNSGLAVTAGTATVTTEQNAVSSVDVSSGATIKTDAAVTVTGAASISGRLEVNSTFATGGALTVSNTGVLVLSQANSLTVNGVLGLDGSTLDLTSLNISVPETQQIIKLADVGSLTAGTVTVTGLDLGARAWSLQNADGSIVLASGGTEGTIASGVAALSTTDSLQLVIAGQGSEQLTATGVIGYNGDSNTLDLAVNSTDLIQYNGKDLAVTVGIDAWNDIVNAMKVEKGGVYNFATITLNGTSLDDFRTVSFNGYKGEGGDPNQYFVAYIPEPATATLSLLALAALAARRRRK